MRAGLRAHARGLYCGQAAVELLIGHDRWLGREDFVGRFVQVGGQPPVGWAWVDWQAVVTARARSVPAATLDFHLFACSQELLLVSGTTAE